MLKERGILLGGTKSAPGTRGAREAVSAGLEWPGKSVRSTVGETGCVGPAEPGADEGSGAACCPIGAGGESASC
jgi:hypothetical protein